MSTAGQEFFTKSKSLWHPFIDFWLLGGLSLIMLLVMATGSLFRESNDGVQFHFVQLASTLSLLAIVCNHPHFMISYKFGYSRGFRFIFKNWLELILVPLLLIAFYGIAFFNFNVDISESWLVTHFNTIFEMAGVGFRLGRNITLGNEILSLSVWLMYFTVGWHYSKQVYGCMMVYAVYDDYRLTELEKKIIKGSVFSVAFFQFIYAAYVVEQSMNSVKDNKFMNVTMTPLGLPNWLYTFSISLTALFALGVVIILVKKYQREKKWPSANFAISWVAFHAWWIPFMQMPEFYLMSVPFFHSLQYLPFAYKVEAKQIEKKRWPYANITVRLLLLFFVGYLAFEAVPAALDLHLDTETNQTALFFMTAFVVFINVHHFFIDSVCWRFSDPEVRESIL